TVSDTFSIADLNVGLNIEHPLRNDVVVFLTSPSGTRREIVSHGAGQANLDVMLDDAATRSIYSDDDLAAHDVDAPYYDQQRRPYQETLSAFRGEAAQGAWTLYICDHFDDDDEGLYYHSQLDFQAQVTYPGTQAAWQYNLPLPRNTEDVTKTLTIYGVDAVGNTSQPITLSFEIDTRPPEIRVDALPAEHIIVTTSPTETLFALTGVVTDAHPTTMRLNGRTPNARFIGARVGQAQGSFRRAADAVSWSYSATGQLFNRTGVYRIWIIAEDEAGNQAQAG
ncbi:MAG: hypothetical protein GY842_20910, partial [bacterium]|nr:hypothetical protein [bacterium]